MKVLELEGPALDYWVARADSYDERWLHRQRQGPVNAIPAFSTDWANGGPIIEREQLNIGPDVRTVGGEAREVWVASAYNGDHEHIGQTLLIAAMRAYVASKFGEEVLP